MVLKGNNGLRIYIEAISCPKICSSIRNQNYHFAKNNYDHLKNVNVLKHSEGDSTSIDSLVGNETIETYLGSFVLSGAFIGKNIFNSTHILRITAEDNFINDYEEEKRVYQDELKGQLKNFGKQRASV